MSFVFHGALLTLRIAAPERFDRLFSDAPLDVILVNTRAKADAPDKAQALAQTQLAGGGELKSGRAASPLPTAATTSVGDMTESMQRQVAQMRKEQSLLLAQVKNLLAQLPPPQPQKSKAEQDAIEQKRRQLLKLLAEIEERNETSKDTMIRYSIAAAAEVYINRVEELPGCKLSKEQAITAIRSAANKMYATNLDSIYIEVKNIVCRTLFAETHVEEVIDHMIRHEGESSEYTPEEQLANSIWDLLARWIVLGQMNIVSA